MSFQPRLYDEMWWVTKIEGSLEIRLFSVGKNKAKCIVECNLMMLEKELASQRKCLHCGASTRHKFDNVTVCHACEGDINV